MQLQVALSMGTVTSADLCITCTSLQSGDQLCALSVWQWWAEKVVFSCCLDITSILFQHPNSQSSSNTFKFCPA